MTLRRFSFGMLLMMVGLMNAACGQQPAVKGGGVGPLGTTKKIIYATIIITPRPSTKTCVATTVPGRVQVKKTEDIEWSIVDFCGATDGYTKDIEVKNWSRVAGSNCSDGTPVPVDTAATGKQHIRRGIKNCTDGSVFKYEIWVTGDANPLADPELEIAS